MQQEWVLDVLTDLKLFAQQNGMFNLAEHLDDTLIVAGAELALHGGRHAMVENAGKVGVSDQHVAAGKLPK